MKPKKDSVMNHVAFKFLVGIQELACRNQVAFIIPKLDSGFLGNCCLGLVGVSRFRVLGFFKGFDGVVCFFGYNTRLMK